MTLPPIFWTVPYRSHLGEQRAIYHVSRMCRSGKGQWYSSENALCTAWCAKFAWNWGTPQRRVSISKIIWALISLSLHVIKLYVYVAGTQKFRGSIIFSLQMEAEWSVMIGCVAPVKVNGTDSLPEMARAMMLTLLPWSKMWKLIISKGCVVCQMWMTKRNCRPNFSTREVPRHICQTASKYRGGKLCPLIRRHIGATCPFQKDVWYVKHEWRKGVR